MIKKACKNPNKGSCFCDAVAAEFSGTEYEKYDIVCGYDPDKKPQRIRFTPDLVWRPISEKPADNIRQVLLYWSDIDSFSVGSYDSFEDGQFYSADGDGADYWMDLTNFPRISNMDERLGSVEINGE